MSGDTREDMPDLSIRDLKTEMDGAFRELKLDIDRRFGRLEARSHEEHIETRRHFDVVAEQLRTDMKLMVEGSCGRLDNHEQRIRRWRNAGADG